MSDNLSKFSPILKNCFFSVSLEQLCTDRLQFFIDNKLNPEISLEGNFLWEVADKQIETVASTLQKHSISCTVHAPFQDLAPGGVDLEIVAATRRKLSKAFHTISILQPKSIICHLGYSPIRHGHKLDQWLKRSVKTWETLLPVAAENNTQVMFENTYEFTPLPLVSLLTRLESFQPQCCLDTGHVIAFSQTDWQDWLEQLLPWLGQVHLHDNDGLSDAHQPLGSGVFDFSGFFKELEKSQKRLLWTFEQRSEKDLLASLQFISQAFPKFPFTTDS